ncbi:dsDNA nuclease domain-containing protein [Hymenobacter pini]|uniref:dsDNA nuclease domain-containing protein n=1 Tax=Hymenobacter pini TaxID=2880879 RepID=UPI001CF1E316|nr:dsDNA nuclease domain-containing protein [Hymenobacter pini]MCA8833313.1 DUF4297 domain-containing protein [Hymenobacter pini]
MPDSIHDLPLGDLSGRHARSGFEYQDHIGAGYCLQMLSNAALEEVWFESHDDITLMWHHEGFGLCYEFVQVKFVDKVWTLGSLTGRTDKRPETSLLEKSLALNKYGEPCTFRLVTSRGACSELKSLCYPIGSPERRAAQPELADAQTTMHAAYARKPQPPTAEAIAFWLANCVWDERESSLGGLEAENLIDLETILVQMGIRLDLENRRRLYDLLMRQISKASHKRPLATRSVFKITSASLQQWLRDTVQSLTNGPDPADRLGSKLQEAGISTAHIEAARELKLLYNDARRDNDFCEPDDLKAMEANILGKVNMLQLRQYNPATEEPPLTFFDTCLTAAVSQLNQRRFVNDDGEVIIPDWVAQGYFYEVIDRCRLRFRNQS